MLATGGLYAPTIRYYNGTVYIVCTNIIHPGNSTEDITQNFIVSTNNIWSNEWSDPIYFDFHGIDPSIFLDDDGRAYIQGSASPGPMTKIHLFEIDLKTGEKLSEEKKIWDGTGGIYPEGPHIYKKDGWYYLMISEGGTHEGHMITVARSRDIWGSYEAFERNPILTTKGTDEYIRYTGHCDMFEDQQGKWWAGCLGVRKDKEGRFVMGRETFLTTGEWLEGDWPKLNQVK
jgi:beta-xylosidase